LDFMNSVLIVGSSGREHAILKALLRSDRPLCMFAYPGNPGLERDGCMLVDKPIENWQDLADWATENQIDLTIVGPEVPLAEGIVDAFKKEGLNIFGPSKDAAQIESSKAFAKDLMKKYSIPTAAYEVFEKKADALAYINEKGAPIVIKVSGLAAGKGAIVCDTMDEALAALDEIFDKKSFGKAGEQVVIEEKMVGEEASIFAVTDGKKYRILPAAQDHKAIGDNDTGPNTGGMGAYAPAPIIDSVMMKRIEDEIVLPTLKAMDKEKCTFRGVLFCGVMITKEGPKVIEFNCRFGDPETQAILPIISCDWYELFMSCAKGRLADVKFDMTAKYGVAVILASKGYPGVYEKGKVITGLDDAEHARSNLDIYHSGTVLNKKDQFVTSGGRVLAVSAWADTLSDAIGLAYEGVVEINFEGKQFRRDIGAKGLRALNRKK